jgi:hypothetical protein
MKIRINNLIRAIGIYAVGIALFVVIAALIPAQAQKKTKYWSGAQNGKSLGKRNNVEFVGPPQRDNYYRRNRRYNSYKKSLKRDLKRHQLSERRELHERQKLERKTYGNNRELKERQREERKALNRHQVKEKKALKSDLKVIRKRKL